MILQINKYHRTSAGETCSSVKVEKPTEIECNRVTLKQFYEQCSNYCADASVIDWACAIVNPRTMERKEYRCYIKPDEPAPEPIPAEAEPS